MQKVCRLLFAACIVFTSIGLVLAQQSPVMNTDRAEVVQEYQPIIALHPEALKPFAVDFSVTDELVQRGNPNIPNLKVLPEYQPLVDFNPKSSTPFAVNPAVVQDLNQDDNQDAAEQLERIEADIADLLARHPQSPAAKRITDILDKAGLAMFPDGGIYPKGTFFSVVPYLR